MAMNSNIHIGTCGFNGSKADYAKQFSCLEVQHTFYQPPQLASLERWRNQVPTDFEFTLKAWQLITHQAKSPTYKRLKKPLSERERSEAGFFRPTAIVDQAWQITLDCARVLRAATLLFQCPASFLPTPEHVANMVDFFSRVDRSGLTLCWEPRGNWSPALIKDLCQDLQLWHVVDPFAHTTVTPDQCYFRLHGRQSWRYQYEPQELRKLIELVPTDNASYIFFNTIHMTQDALMFKELLNTNPV